MRKIKWTAQAQDDVRKIDRQSAMQILLVIDCFARTGHGDVKRLRPPRTELRLRAGEWRVFFFSEPTDVMRILRVLHRSVAYR